MNLLQAGLSTRRQQFSALGRCCEARAGVIGNLASPVFGTPTQNTLAILEPPSKIR